MSTTAGDPIWPYGDAETLVALTRIAELFDSSIVEEQPRAAVGAVRRRREGTVMSIDAETDDVASLYAHLTKRRFEAARNSPLLETRRPDVVVVPVDRLTPDFLRQLYSHPKWAPGLITAGSPGALLRQALLRAAAVRLCGGTSGRHVDIRAVAEHGRIDLGHREILGGQAKPAELRRALGSGSELLTVFTVGDGIDASLGPLTLCPMNRKPASSEEGAPACVESGTCHRLQLPMAEALDSARLIPPEAIAARVLILHACWGIQPAGSLHGPAGGYGYRLADHDRLGAMLTTWRVTIGSSGDTEALASDLARGMPVGTALARFNRSASSRRTGQLMCLLGDPKVRVSIEAQAPVARRSAPRNGAYEEEGRQLAFLAAYLDMMGPTKETEALHSAARNAIAECQQSAWSGLPIALDHSGPTLRQAVLEWLCKLGTIPAYHWMTFADLVSAKDSGTRCFACGQSVQELSFRLRVVAAGSRNMHVCPRCGLIEDRPAKMRRIGLTIEEEMACLHRSLPRGGWAGLLLFRPHVGRHKSRLWPADKDGKPLPGAAIFDPGEPRGAGQLQLYMMEGASLSFARAVYLPRLDRRAGGRGRAV